MNVTRAVLDGLGKTMFTNFTMGASLARLSRALHCPRTRFADLARDGRVGTEFLEDLGKILVFLLAVVTFYRLFNFGGISHGRLYSRLLAKPISSACAGSSRIGRRHPQHFRCSPPPARNDTLPPPAFAEMALERDRG